MEWKDVTSYSRGDTDRTPRAWAIEHGNVRVSVYVGRRECEGMWFASSYALGFQDRHLKGVTDADAAKVAALRLARTTLAQLNADLAAICTLDAA